MERFLVIIERPAREDIENHYLRAVEVGAGESAAGWYRRIVEVIQSLGERAEWRGSVPEQDEFSERIYQVIFERRFRIIYTVIANRVHVLCVRGPGMSEMGPADIEWPASEDDGG